MSILGLYFGPQVISIVETKGNKPVNTIKIPWPAILGSNAAEGQEEKVPEEIKLVTLINDELAKNKIESKEAAVSLSGKDLIVRTFEMPVIPNKEMDKNAIRFESTKYVPFKLEELISDSRWKIDKLTKKNRILYVGIRQEIFHKYVSVLNELKIKIRTIEYSAFSILRLLNLSNIKEKGVVAVFNLDLAEGDEVNFMVLESSFPLFSRDISLSTVYQETQEPPESRLEKSLDKFKREIRISLDYYHRKFPTKKIEKTFFICPVDYHAELETFIKELGLSIQFIEIAKYIPDAAYSLSLIKAYAASLSASIKTDFSINLFVAQKKISALKEISAVALKQQLFRLPAGLHIEPKILIVSGLICFLTFIFGLFQITTTKKNLQGVADMQVVVSVVKPNVTIEELNTINSQYKEKAVAIDNLKMKRIYLTDLLDTLPRIIPENIWLLDLSCEFKEKENMKINLQGYAYLGDSNQEFDLVNNFRSKLLEDAIFNKYFKKIDINSLSRALGQRDKDIVTNFSILCKNEYK